MKEMKKKIIEKSYELILLLDNCDDEEVVDMVKNAINNNDVTIFGELGVDFG